MHALDHIALVVQQLEPVLTRCASCALTAGPIEDFPEEATREVYLGPAGHPARLLLIQPTDSTGPYARALVKRGPGLHHLALNVPQLDLFLAENPGWLLHPTSLQTLARSRTAWLARPGVGTLLEVQEATTSYAGPAIVEQVEVTVAPGLEALLPPRVGGRAVEGLLSGSGEHSSLQLAGRRLGIDELVGPATER